MRSIRKFAIAAVVTFACAAAQAQAPAAAAPAAGAPPQGQEEPKNVQVLKGMSHDDIVQSMQFMSSSLGVECDFCHVRKDNRLQPDLDDKREKKTAREMLKMTKGINDTYFEGHQEVTCASCHNGRNQPRPFPPIADLDTLKARIAANEARQQRERLLAQNSTQPGGPTSGAPTTGAPTSGAPTGGAPGAGAPGGRPPAGGPQGGPRPQQGPTPAELFAKYEQAIGGADALAKLTSRTDKYTTLNPVNGNTVNGETLRKAPNKVVSTTTTDRGSNTMIYDGASAWSKNARGTQPVSGPNLDQMKFVSNFWRDLKLSDRYQNARSRGKDKINGKDVYVVQGTVKDSNQREQLFFDAETGLLVRRITYRPTPMGPTADQIDFEDYRDVGGVKVPFVLKSAFADGMSTRTYTDVKFNVPVDDAKFSAPADAPKQ